MGSSFFSDPTDYTAVDEGGDGSGFYDGPAYTAIDPVAVADSVATAAASAATATAAAAEALASASSAAATVQAAAGTATPLVDGTAAVGAGAKWAREDHVHPTDTSRASVTYVDAQDATLTAAVALKAPLASPALTGTPTAPTASVGTDTTQLATTAFVFDNAAPIDALAYSGMQVNGAMGISQENGSTARTTAGYVVDGWEVFSSGAQTFSAAQVADAPPGLTNSIKITVTGANASPGAGDYLGFRHKIEGYRSARLAFGSASAQSVSIGFWLKTHRTGAYSGSLRNAAGSRSYPFSFTQNAVDTWEFKTVTIPGDATGTWVGATNASALEISFTVGSGASSLGAAATWAAAAYIGVTGSTNGMAATTDTLQITGVIALPGVELPSSGRSALIMRPFDQELFACQRYYAKSFPVGSAPAQGTTADNVRDRYAGFAWSAVAVDTQRIPYPVRMRATPTITAYSPNNSSVAPSSGMWQIYDGASTFVNATSMVTTNSVSESGFNLSLGLPSVTSKSAYITYGSWAADARL